MNRSNKWEFIGDNMFCCPSCGTPYTQEQFKAIMIHRDEAYFPDYCPNCGENMSGETIGKWIPVTERLPENDDAVLITYSGSRVTKGFWTGEKWRHVAVKELKSVVAWMPIKPYKEKKN